MSKIGVLLYNYNRIDDVFINMEIIRNVWPIEKEFKNIKIIHAYNGKLEWYQEKYLEDSLIRLKNLGHFKGAENLLDNGIKEIYSKYPDLDYVIILAADTWCLKPKYISKLIRTMKEEGKYMATCAWGTKDQNDMFKIGMSLDFSIIDLKFAIKNNIFPLRYTEFFEKYFEIFAYQGVTIFPERVLALRFQQAINNTFELPSAHLLRKVAYEHVLHIKEREPIHIFKKKIFKKPMQYRRMEFKNIGLLTHHEPKPKQKALRKYKYRLGEHGEKFKKAKDLSYYNQGFTKTKIKRKDKIIDYND